MHSVINKALFLAFIAAFCYKPAMAGTVAPLEPAYSNIFSADLFPVIVDDKTTENIVYSPHSIHAALSFAFIGAEGQTSKDMREVLKLGEGDKEQVLEKYGDYLKSTFTSSNLSDNAPQLTMANRMYVNSRLELAPKFNKIAQEYFEFEAENVDFKMNNEAVGKINQWVEQQTNNKIQNLLQPGTVDENTSALLVNAIYFKAKWLHPFSNSSTTKSAFHVNNELQIEVDTMYTSDRFGYAELPELEAKALEMPYQNPNISMLIILPNKVDGLKKLEAKLKGLDLNKISSRMVVTDVDVFLPKFRIEYDIDLKEPLQKLGLDSMFNKAANFTSLFNSTENHRISDVKHKAYLDVNEAGSEAAASTYIKIVPMSLNFDQKLFRADHPFVFAIRSKTAVYFTGHVTKF